MTCLSNSDGTKASQFHPRRHSHDKFYQAPLFFAYNVQKLLGTIKARALLFQLIVYAVYIYSLRARQKDQTKRKTSRKKTWLGKCNHESTCNFVLYMFQSRGLSSRLRNALSSIGLGRRAAASFKHVPPVDPDDFSTKVNLLFCISMYSKHKLSDLLIQHYYASFISKLILHSYILLVNVVSHNRLKVKFSTLIFVIVYTCAIFLWVALLSLG